MSGVGEPGFKSFGRIRSFLLIFATDPRGCKSSTVLLFEFRWEHFDDSSLLSMTFVKILQVNNYSNANKQKASSVFANSEALALVLKNHRLPTFSPPRKVRKEV